MEVKDIFKGGNSLYVISGEDLPRLAELLSNYFGAEKVKPEILEPRKPISQIEAMRVLNRSRQTIVKWRKKGVLKGFMIGGRIYFHPEEIDALQQLKG